MFLGQIENDFNCAGMCVAPLFYVSKQTSFGIPPEECFVGYYEGTKTVLVDFGNIALITGTLMLLGFIMSIPLCSDYHDDDDIEKKV